MSLELAVFLTVGGVVLGLFALLMILKGGKPT